MNKKKYIVIFLGLLVSLNSTAVAPAVQKKAASVPSSAKSSAAASGKTVKQKEQKAASKSAAKPAVTSTVASDWVEVDAIKTVIYAEGDSEVITTADVNRPSVAGQMRTLDDIIFEYLVYLDAKRHKIMTDDASVDRYLAAIQKEHNLKPEQLKQIFSQAGYSFEEGRAQLKMIQATNAMLDFKIRSNLIVPRRQAEEYYNAHPELEEESYQLQTGVISHKEGRDKNEERAEVERFAESGFGDVQVNWSTEFWVNKSDIASEQRFIYTMKPGQVVLAQETPDSFILYRLKARKEERLRSFDDRYLEIADILRKPRYEELLTEYRDYLYKNAAIVTF